jgi:hypothetical protein
MSFSWKDTIATISLVIAAGFSIALLLGAFEALEGRWALGTLGLLLVGVITGLVTGTAKMMKDMLSSAATYILAASAVVITIVNAFINSEVWLIAMLATIILLWLDFVTTDMLGKDTNGRTHISSGGL